MKRYFLAQAANFSGKEVLAHTFAVGTARDFEVLKAYLAERYNTTVDKVALYGTGRSALAAGIKTLVPEGGEVLATSLTCYAVVEAIEAAGCTPVFADADAQVLHFGVKELKAALEKHPKVKAVIVQNNLGMPVDIKGIEKICKEKGIYLIEDLAHSAGIKYADGREAGTVGDVTVLSFGKGKSVDTISGGALVLSDKLTEKAYQPENAPVVDDDLRARFYPLFGVMMRGLSYIGLMRYFTALLLKLKWIERSADARLDLNTRLSYWQARLALKKLMDLPENRPPIRKFYLVKNREEVLKKLAKHGFIFDDTWYNIPVAPERYFERVNFKAEECPVAVKLAGQIINFPVHYTESELKPAEKIVKEYLDEA